MPRGKVRAELIPDSSWKRAGKILGPHASQTAARLSRVFAFAEKVWGNEKDAAEWMNRPHMELGGATPYSDAADRGWRTRGGECAGGS